MAQSEFNHPRILTALYTLKFTWDPLINRSLLCKNPRILQGYFQLYKYNIDVMEKIALSVKCSFHFTTFTHASEQKASSLSSCTSIVFLTNLNYPYTPTLSMIQLILTLTLTPKPILTKSNLNNNVPTNVCNFECHGQKNNFCVP